MIKGLPKVVTLTAEQNSEKKMGNVVRTYGVVLLITKSNPYYIVFLMYEKE